MPSASHRLCPMLLLCLAAPVAAHGQVEVGRRRVSEALVTRARVAGDPARERLRPSVPGGDGLPAPATSLSDEIVSMASAAAIIFTGEVTAVEQHGGVVDVSFAVESAVRGANPGGSFRLREWAGLWENGVPRYRRGQRLLVMLHAPSVAGFASPVGGSDGLIPLHGDAATGTADLRWVAARVQRAAASEASGIQQPLRPLAEVTLRRTGTVMGSVARSGSAVDTDPAAVPCAELLGMLGGSTAAGALPHASVSPHAAVDVKPASQSVSQHAAAAAAGKAR